MEAGTYGQVMTGTPRRLLRCLSSWGIRIQACIRSLGHGQPDFARLSDRAVAVLLPMAPQDAAINQISQALGSIWSCLLAWPAIHGNSAGRLQPSLPSSSYKNQPLPLSSVSVHAESCRIQAAPSALMLVEKATCMNTFPAWSAALWNWFRNA